MNSPLRAIGILAVLLSVPSCTNSSDPSNQPVPFSAQLIKPADSADLEIRLKAELTKRYERAYSSSVYYGTMDGGGAAIAPPPQPAGIDDGSGDFTSAGSGSETFHSDTNVQEKGVDEDDLVETDGTYIYLARGSHFFVLQANPADQMAVVSDIDLAEPISELYLSGSRVIIITNSYVSIAPGTYLWDKPVTRIHCYDVTNPVAPVLTAKFDFPGYLQGSRRISSSDKLYVVINYTIDIPSPVSPWDYLDPGTFYDSDAYTQANSQALTENLKRIEEATLDDLLPAYTVIFTGGTPSTVPAVSSDGIFIPEFGNGTDLSIVVSLDLAGQVPAIAATSGVLSSWCSVYMSPDSLYLTSDTRWLWIQPMADADTPPANPEPQTAVHKFSVAGPEGKPLYKGSAVVDGWLNNRFSMSAYQGYLRIGTTRGGWWGEEISNQLAVLAEGGNGLVEVGKLTGIAPREPIYSMRFDGDRGYMVTFLQIDPLFTFDLSDPANPRLAGEIPVTGFSTYIHLLGPDNTRLLTIGTSNGRFSGNKLQLFDVSDLAAPRLLSSFELGPGWSDALYDPHAFLYYEPLGILTIPYFAYGATYDSYSSGLNVFDIDPVGGAISQRGVISSPTVTAIFGDYSYSYFDTVDRSVIIGTNIYALAHRSVTVAGSDLLNVVKTVTLPESYYPYGMVVPHGGGIAVPLAPSASHANSFH